MDEELTKKPMAEILKDIHQSAEYRQRLRGVVNPELVNRISFIACLVSLFLSMAISLAMIWGAFDPILGLKCLGSILVVLIAILMFRGLNSQFSP